MRIYSTVLTILLPIIRSDTPTENDETGDNNAFEKPQYSYVSLEGDFKILLSGDELPSLLLPSSKMCSICSKSLINNDNNIDENNDKISKVLDKSLLILESIKKIKDSPNCLHLDCTSTYLRENHHCHMCIDNFNRAELLAIISIERILKLNPANISETEENDVLTLITNTYKENNNGIVKVFLNEYFPLSLLKKIFNIFSKKKSYKYKSILEELRNIIQIKEILEIENETTDLKKCIECWNKLLKLLRWHPEIINHMCRLISQTNLSSVIESIDLSQKWDEMNRLNSYEEMFDQMENLTSLNISGNRIDTVLERIKRLLKKHRNLSSLNISMNELGTAGSKAIAESLEFLDNLISLDISSNQINNEGAKVIADALKNHKNFKMLHAKCNSINDEGAEAIADVVENHENLETLDVSSNQISNKGAKIIADALKQHDDLRSFDISNNKIGDDGITEIMNALEKHTNITSLKFSDCGFGERGIKRISEILSNFRDLENLDVGYNNMSDSDVVELANALKEHNKLKSLNISNSDIKHAGIRELENLKKILNGLDIFY